jgi:hypothetical protein
MTAVLLGYILFLKKALAKAAYFLESALNDVNSASISAVHMLAKLVLLMPGN